MNISIISTISVFIPQLHKVFNINYQNKIKILEENSSEFITVITRNELFGHNVCWNWCKSSSKMGLTLQIRMFNNFYKMSS